MRKISVHSPQCLQSISQIFDRLIFRCLIVSFEICTQILNQYLSFPFLCKIYWIAAPIILEIFKLLNDCLNLSIRSIYARRQFFKVYRKILLHGLTCANVLRKLRLM